MFGHHNKVKETYKIMTKCLTSSIYLRYPIDVSMYNLIKSLKNFEHQSTSDESLN